MIARRKETMQVQELVGIVPWTFIAQICNLFIQMYLIKRFLFKPINEMLEKRRAAADAEITDAEAAKKEANAIKEEYEQNMQEAKAKANEIPLKYWNPLQKGESIEAGGKVYTPDMVLGPARKGLKVTNAAERENRKRGFRTGSCPEKQGRKRDCPGEKESGQ